MTSTPNIGSSDELRRWRLGHLGGANTFPKSRPFEGKTSFQVTDVLQKALNNPPTSVFWSNLRGLWNSSVQANGDY